MKRFYLVIIIIVAAVSSSDGQIDKPISMGHIIFGGSVSFSKNNIERTSNLHGHISTDSRIEINTDIAFGFFFAKNIAAGLKADYTFFRYIDESGGKSDHSSFLLKPFVRYCTPIGLFGEGAYGFGYQRIGLPGQDPDEDRKINCWNLGLGYSYFIQKGIAIEPRIQYELTNGFRSDNQTNEKINTFSAHLGILIYINVFSKEP